MYNQNQPAFNPNQQQYSQTPMPDQYPNQSGPMYQQPQAPQQQNKGTFEDMIFTGYSLAPGNSQGVTKHGKQWQKFKMNFLREGKQNPNKFNMFAPLVDKSRYKHPTELQVGQKYSVGYNVDQRTGPNGPYQSKTIFMISDVRGGNQMTAPAQPQQATQYPQSTMYNVGNQQVAPAASYPIPSQQQPNQPPQPPVQPPHMQAQPQQQQSGGGLPPMGLAPTGVPNHGSVLTAEEDRVITEMKKNPEYVQHSRQSLEHFKQAYNQAAQYFKAAPLTLDADRQTMLYHTFLQGLQ